MSTIKTLHRYKVNGKTWVSAGTIDNPDAVKISKEDYKISLGKVKYTLLYQLDGIRVEKYEHPMPVGTEFRITDDNRLHSFGTVVNLMEFTINPDKTKDENKKAFHEHLLTLIDDSIEMDIDKRNAESEFTEFEILNEG